MSVVVVARMKADASAIQSLFASHKDAFEAIAADAKRAGAQHHRFLAGEGEVVIVDEWDAPESFHRFFADPRIAELMQSGGVAGPPEIAVYEPMTSPDEF